MTNTLMADHPDDRPPWWQTPWWQTPCWQTILMRDHPDDKHPDNRPPWWETTLMTDHPDERSPLKTDHPVERPSPLDKHPDETTLTTNTDERPSWRGITPLLKLLCLKLFPSYFHVNGLLQGTTPSLRPLLLDFNSLFHCTYIPWRQVRGQVEEMTATMNNFWRWVTGVFLFLLYYYHYYYYRTLKSGMDSSMHVWDQVKSWILKGEKPHPKCTSKPFSNFLIL